MTKPKRLRSDSEEIEVKEIRYSSDLQLNWSSLIPELRRFTLEKVDFLSIPGDAPKDFITDSEYRPGHRGRREKEESYIAKVGSKFYPNESITEQLLTRIGQVFGLSIADSKLRMVQGQVRFMSKYFLNRREEQLIHGAQIFEQCLGKEDYAEIAEKKMERDYFTFQMVCEAIRVPFAGFENKIVRGLIEMLTFDCLIGHNDRHPYNWGVIVPIHTVKTPRFSPVYDTARALFWNVPEARVQQMLRDKKQLETYINKCAPPFAWDGEPDVDFFRLIGLIWKEFDRYRTPIEKFLNEDALAQTLQMVDKEFGTMMSGERRQLIRDCLRIRFGLLRDTVRG